MNNTQIIEAAQLFSAQFKQYLDDLGAISPYDRDLVAKVDSLREKFRTHVSEALEKVSPGINLDPYFLVDSISIIAGAAVEAGAPKVADEVLLNPLSRYSSIAKIVEDFTGEERSHLRYCFFLVQAAAKMAEAKAIEQKGPYKLSEFLMGMPSPTPEDPEPKEMILDVRVHGAKYPAIFNPPKPLTDVFATEAGPVWAMTLKGLEDGLLRPALSLVDDLAAEGIEGIIADEMEIDSQDLSKKIYRGGESGVIISGISLMSAFRIEQMNNVRGVEVLDTLNNLKNYIGLKPIY